LNNCEENIVQLFYKNVENSYKMEQLFSNESNLNLEAIMKYVNFNITDRNGRTFLMFLLEHENYTLFISILRELRNEARKSSNPKRFNINYRSKINNESIFSIFIKKYYEMCCKKTYLKVVTKHIRDLITSMGIILSLIMSYLGRNINIPIDNDYNTPIMFFLMIEDIVAVNFILSCCEDVDLGIRNRNGISASALALKIKDKMMITQQLIKHRTFDKQFADPLNNIFRLI